MQQQGQDKQIVDHSYNRNGEVKRFKCEARERDCSRNEPTWTVGVLQRHE